MRRWGGWSWTRNLQDSVTDSTRNSKRCLSLAPGRPLAERKRTECSVFWLHISRVQRIHGSLFGKRGGGVQQSGGKVRQSIRGLGDEFPSCSLEGPEDPLEKETATHFSILAWEIPWTEEPGGL